MNGSSAWPLFTQSLLGRIAVFFIGPATWAFIRLRGWRFRDLGRTREACWRHFRRHEGPWIVCANHLTLIDSVLLTYAMLPLHRYLFGYRWLAWNLPERTNFNRNILLSALTYLAKCIPVQRGGDRDEMKKQLEKCNALLEHGQILMIFPEGGRSRTGRVDRESFSYGAGRFLAQFPDCKVLCLYLRGDGQDTYSDFPASGERFSVDVDVIEPRRAESGGLKAQREYALQIVSRLCQMEDQYFARRQRHREPLGSPQPGKEPGSALPGEGLYPAGKG